MTLVSHGLKEESGRVGDKVAVESEAASVAGWLAFSCPHGLELVTSNTRKTHSG